MNCILKVIFIFFVLSPCVNSVDLELKGKIDLGPTWSVDLQPLSSTRLKRKRLDSIPQAISRMIAQHFELKGKSDDKVTPDSLRLKKDRHSRGESNANNKMKKFETKSTVYDEVRLHGTAKYIYVEPRKVHDDAQINEFTNNVYKQSMRVFDKMKEKMPDKKIQKEIDLLAQNYKDKFGAFANKTQNHTIKTRLGRQKVIINTINTSNAILKRLVNYINVKMDKHMLRNRIPANVFHNDVNKKIESEKKYICKKFGICRSRDGFSNFMVEFLDIILSTNDDKVKEAGDALTEVLKYADFNSVMDANTAKRFQKGLSNFETYDVSLLRPIFYMMRNLLVNKYKPIEVVGQVDERVNKTVAILEIIEALDNALPPNDENLLVWQDINNSLTGWRDGKRKDIVEIVESYVDTIKKGIDSFDAQAKINFERNTNIFFS